MQRNTPKAISKSILSLLCYWHNVFMEYSALWRAWGLDTVSAAGSLEVKVCLHVIFASGFVSLSSFVVQHSSGRCCEFVFFLLLCRTTEFTVAQRTMFNRWMCSFLCVQFFSFFYLWLDCTSCALVFLCRLLSSQKNGECSDEHLNEQFGVASQIYRVQIWFTTIWWWRCTSECS